MGFGRKIRNFSIAGIVAAAGIVSTGAARAEIIDQHGYHYQNQADDQQCLLGDSGTATVQQYRCLNALSEEWRPIGVALYPGGPLDYVELNNVLTDQCMAVPSWPVNGTKVILAPCDAQNVRLFWRRVNDNGILGGGVTHLVSFQGALCLDKPRGNTVQGAQIQTWACNGSDQQTWRLL
jgi:hypothetical protein